MKLRQEEEEDMWARRGRVSASSVHSVDENVGKMTYRCFRKSEQIARASGFSSMNCA